MTAMLILGDLEILLGGVLERASPGGRKGGGDLGEEWVGGGAGLGIKRGVRIALGGVGGSAPEN